MSTLKVDTLDTSNGTGNITLSRPIVGDGSNLTGVAPTKTTIEALGIDVPAANLTGTVADARFPATLPASSGANLTSLPAASLTGTIADARFPATLPASSGVNLTALNASNISSGTLPAIDGSSLTGTYKQNYVINGSYEINQENDTAATDGTYSIGDLFMYVGEASATTSLQTSSGPQGDRKFARINVDTANAQAGWYYPISNADCQDFIQDGKLSWSLSIASPSSLIGTVRMGVVKWNSTADAFTRDIVNSWGQDGTNPTLKSNLTFENTPVDVNINATFTTYTVENVTVDSDTKNILLFVWIDDGTITANDKLDVAQWQCNTGSTVKPFSSVSKATTYMDVVHYLYAPLFDDYDGQKCDFGAGLFNWSGNTMAYKQYPREMHKIPTYTGFPMDSGTPANSSIWGQAGANAYYLTADTAGNIGTKEVYRNFLGVHSNNTGFVGWIQRKGTSSNCQIILDARLGA